MRSRLVELIQNIIIPYWAEIIADHLIANGVIIPVRCKDCKDHVLDNASGETWCNNPRGLCSMITDNDFCPFGERKDNGNS